MSEKAAPAVCLDRLVDVLGILAVIQRDLEPDSDEMNRINRCIKWLNRRIYEDAGVRQTETREIINRLADGIGLDVTVPSDNAEPYPVQLLATAYVCGGLHDLSSVLPRLHKLDVDGTTAELWRIMWRRCPILREIVSEAYGSKTAADPAATPVGETPGADTAKPTPSTTPPAAAPPAVEPPPNPRTPRKPKKSTQRGEARRKIIAALSKHHKYAEGGSLNYDPIGNNELARQAEVEESTASLFFKKAFQGHDKYRALCRSKGELVAALKALNGDIPPYLLYGRTPPDEGSTDDE